MINDKQQNLDSSLLKLKIICLFEFRVNTVSIIFSSFLQVDGIVISNYHSRYVVVPEELIHSHIL
jgi:hypothetical protein